MKLFLFVLFIVSFVFVYSLTRTNTIEEDEFSAIQSACAGGDDLIYYYYQKCLGRAELPREDWGDWVDEMGNRDYQGIGSYANLAMVGAIDELQTSQQTNAKLTDAYNFIN